MHLAVNSNINGNDFANAIANGNPNDSVDNKQMMSSFFVFVIIVFFY